MILQKKTLKHTVMDRTYTFSYQVMLHSHDHCYCLCISNTNLTKNLHRGTFVFCKDFHSLSQYQNSKLLKVIYPLKYPMGFKNYIYISFTATGHYNARVMFAGTEQTHTIHSTKCKGTTSSTRQNETVHVRVPDREVSPPLGLV